MLNFSMVEITKYLIATDEQYLCSVYILPEDKLNIRCRWLIFLPVYKQIAHFPGLINNSIHT